MIKINNTTLHVDKLILGGGISAISFAHFYSKDDYHIIEKSNTLGGLCRSHKVGKSIFDYAGHFLHFNDQQMKEYLSKLLLTHSFGEFIEYTRNANICLLKNNKIHTSVDYPFQANIHQLDKDDFIECLAGLYHANATAHSDLSTFEDIIFHTFGKGLLNKFFKPYNEKLYCTDLKSLDATAMKRFLPTATFDDVMKNIINPTAFGYNSTFLYSPTTGIQGVVDALCSAVCSDKKINYSLNEEVLQIDSANKIVITAKRTIAYNTLINTLPLTTFNKLNKDETNLQLQSVDVDVYNITYTTDCSNIRNASWTYFPDKEVPFYRVGFYNQITSAHNTSVYVEVARKTNTPVIHSLLEIDTILKNTNIIKKTAQIQDSLYLQISPAYAILNTTTVHDVAEYTDVLKCLDIYLLGRYGSWTYSSIEDDILKAKALAINLSNNHD